MDAPGLGVGIIGAGRIFDQHARAYAALGSRVRLLGIADVSEAQLARATERHVIPHVFRDHRALIERDDVELVAVCTPPAFHERAVIDALEAGKYVMCEKPLAHTLEAADRILATARRFPGKLSTVYQFRYLPEVQRTIWLRDHGRLGRLLLGRFTRAARFEAPPRPNKPGKPAKPAKVRAAWWGQWDTAGGGAVMTQLIHEIDLMCHVFGPAVEVTATMDTLKEPIESEDTCAATIRFDSGALVTCCGTMVAHRPSSTFDVYGELGSSHSPWAFQAIDDKWRDDSLSAVLAAHSAASETPSASGVEPSDHTPYVAAVVDAIEHGRALPINGEEGRASLEVCTAIYASALSQRPISLPFDARNPYYRGVTTADYDGRARRHQHDLSQNTELSPTGSC